MADENKIETQLTVDTKPAEQSLDKFAKKTEKTLSSSFSGGGLMGELPKQAEQVGVETAEKFSLGLSSGITDLSSMMTSPIVIAFSSAAAVASKLVSDIFEGEAVKKIEKNFDGVTQSFNVAGQKMLDTFMANTGGLVDNTDVMKMLTEKTITFSGEVDRLPELFNVARKAGSVFGKESLDVFDDLTRAAQTGNAKLVKYLFPKLDLDKELAKYAYANKILVSDLTETQRQQIALNTLIDLGSKKFEGASVSVGSLTEEWQKLKVAYANWREEQQKAASDGLFSNSLKTAAIQTRQLIESASPENQLVLFPKGQADEIHNITLATKKYNEALVELNATGSTAAAKSAAFWKQTKLDAEAGLASMKKQADATGPIMDMFKLNFQGQPVAPTLPVPLAGGFKTEQQKEEEKRQAEAQANYLKRQKEFLNAYELQSIESQNAVLAKTFEKNKSAEVAEVMHQNNLSKIKMESATSINTLGKQMLDKGLIDEHSYRNGSYMSTQAYLNAKALLQQQARDKEAIEEKAHQERMKQAEQQAYAERMSGVQGFSEMMKSHWEMMKISSKDMADSYTQSMKQVADASVRSLGNSVASGFKKMALAMREGKNAVQAFGEAFLAAIGDAMVQMGTSYIAMAIPMIILQDPRGFPLLAAGAGLITAGVLLSASVGGGTTQGAGAASTGAASPSSFDTTGGPASENNFANKNAQTGVNVVVQGNVYDMEATGRNIADVISQAFQTQGVKVYS